MARIETYAFDSNLSLDDFVIGSDADNINVTRNYPLGSIFSTFKTGLNLASIEYTFSDATDPDLDEFDAGYFVTNGNQTAATAITSITLNKFDGNGIDITSLLEVIDDQPTSFVLRIFKASVVGQVFYFAISSIVDNLDDTFTINVTNFVGGNSLIDATTYSMVFDLAGVPSIYTETDPVFLASPVGAVTAPDVTNWTTAYGWGDHSVAGYQAALSGTGIVKSTTGTISYLTDNSTNWNTAFGWGNHASAGYLTSFTESDPVFLASDAAAVTSVLIGTWNLAYTWGNHAVAGYLTAETDPVFIASDVFGVTTADINSWDAAYQWGDHDGLYLPIGGGTMTGNINMNGFEIQQASRVDIRNTVYAGTDTMTFDWDSINDFSLRLFGGQGITYSISADKWFYKGSELMNLGSTQTVLGAITFSLDVTVPDEVYGVGWNASLEVPTKNALYDKIETIVPTLEMLSTGLNSGGVLSINVDTTKFDISAGTGIIVDHSTSPPTTTSVSWGAFTAQTVTNLATQFATDIAINAAGAIVQQTSFTNEELRSLIFLGGLDHSNKTNIGGAFSITIPTKAIGSGLKELSKAIGDLNISGNIYSPNGVNLNLNKSAGSVFSYGRNFTTNVDAPHVFATAIDTGLTFNYVYNNGSGIGSFDAATTVINPNSYDVGTGTLASVTANRYTIQRLLLFGNSNKTFVQYGTAQYVRFEDALDAVPRAQFEALAGIRSAIVRGYLVVQQGETDLNNATFLSANRFGLVAPLAAGVAQTFDALTDTNFTAVAKGDVAVFDGTSWVDLTVGANDTVLTADSATSTGVKWATSIATLDGLTDTTITGAVKGDILVYNGSAWVDLTVGTNTYLLTANSVTATGLEWTAPPTSAVWGSITGTLSSQTDLQSALDARLQLSEAIGITTGSTSGDLNNSSTGVFYATSGTLNRPIDVNSHIFSQDLGSGYSQQIGGRNHRLFFRHEEASVWGSWNEFYHTGNLTLTDYVAVTGDTMTGDLIIDNGATQENLIVEHGFVSAKNDGNTWRTLLGNSSSARNYLVGGSSIDSVNTLDTYLRIRSIADGDLIFQENSLAHKIYHEGNLTPSDYVLKAGDTMTGDLTVNARLTIPNAAVNQWAFIADTNNVNYSGLWFTTAGDGMLILRDSLGSSTQLTYDATTAGLNITGNVNSDGSYYKGDDKNIIQFSDAWLRINPSNDFTNGIYCGSGILRTDGEFQVGGSGANFKVTASGAMTVLGTSVLTGLLTANAGVGTTFIGLDRGSSVSDATTVFSGVSAPANSIVVASNTTGSTGYPSAFGGGMYVRGATETRDFAFWRNNSDNNSGLYAGHKSGTTWVWNKLWHQGNDGIGSGLDADKIHNFGRTASGDRWGNFVINETSGVIEIGRYIDFHNTDGDTSDNTGRLDNTTNGILRWTSSSATDIIEVYNSSTEFAQLAANASGGYLILSDDALTNTIIRGYGDSEFYGGGVYTKGSLGGIGTEHTIGSSFQLFSVGGGNLHSTGSSVTGTMRVRLPTAARSTNDMVQFSVMINDYAGGDGGGESVSVDIIGYPHASGWANTNATVHTSRNDRDYNVRFASDGSYHYVEIGTTTQNWAYPQAYIYNVFAGYTANISNWEQGWNVSVQASYTGTQDHIVTDNYPTAGRLSTRAGDLYSNTTTTYWDMDADKDLLIRDVTTTRFTFDVSLGRLTATEDMYAVDFNLSSDERLKKNIKPLEDYKVVTNWVEYDWINNDKHDIGVIAQDLEKTNPEFVKTAEDGYKSVNYTKLLIAKNIQLENKVKELEARMDRLETLLTIGLN